MPSISYALALIQEPPPPPQPGPKAVTDPSTHRYRELHIYWAFIYIPSLSYFLIWEVYIRCIAYMNIIDSYRVIHVWAFGQKSACTVYISGLSCRNTQTEEHHHPDWLLAARHLYATSSYRPLCLCATSSYRPLCLCATSSYRPLCLCATSSYRPSVCVLPPAIELGRLCYLQL